MTTDIGFQNRIPVGDDARQLAMYLLDTYFKTQPYVFTKHHIDSYDQFLSKDLTSLIKSENPILILKDKIANTDDYRYKVEIFVGGEDGSKIEIGLPTVALQNTEEVRLLFPNEARLRNLTYSSLVLADIVCRISITTPTQQGLTDVQLHERTFNKFPLFRIPIMLQSRYCSLHGKSTEFLEEAGEDPQDYGGYFIIDGSEKVLITKQEQAFNTLYVNKQDRDPKVSHFASISCLSPVTRQVKRVSFYYLREFDKEAKKGRQYATLQVGLPFVRKAVPLFVLFRALGFQTDEEIVRLILPDPDSAESRLLEPYLVNSINEAYPFLDTYSAIQYIKSLTKGFSEAHVLDVLQNSFFIHIENNTHARAAFLGDCARRILRVVAGLDPKTDKDDIRNQRCLVSGFSTQMLFSGIYVNWVKAVALAIDKQYNYNEKLYSGLNFLNIFAPGNTNLIFKPLYITDGLMRAFKGRWGSGMGEDKAGLIQQLSRMSYLDFMSHCRRVVLDFDTGMKLTGPRHLHPSQFGYFCTSEVPSGATIGITKNLSMMTAISTASDPTKISTFLISKGWVLPCRVATQEQRATYVPFFLNGGLLGYCSDPTKVAKALQYMKRTGFLAPLSSIGFSIRDRQVFLYVDEGRPLRPLIYLAQPSEFPLERMKELKTWLTLVCGTAREGIQLASTDFVDADAGIGSLKTPDDYIEFLKPKAGVIEYVDPYEHNLSYIATFPDYINAETTHVEIHPSTILSVLTGIIPFPNHNQSPRNQLGDSQSKQGLSIYATNFDNRFDNMAHVLCYGEAPLVRTMYYDYIGNGKMSYGHNCILAIASFTGYNQEDGIVMNHDSVQRGLFRSMAFRTYEGFEEDDPVSKAKTRIGNPAKIVAWTDIKPGIDYSKLDDAGIVRVGEYVDENTVICGKYIQLSTGQIRDASVTGQVWTRGRVEKIAILVSPTGLRTVKIRVVQDRTPELGDKFCLTPDHDVLTKQRGWVPISNISLEDEVAQLNKEKGTMEYIKPKEIYIFDHEGDLYEVETQGVSLKTTLNHRMWVQKRNEDSYQLIEAKDVIGKRVKYQAYAPIGGDEKDIIINTYTFSKGEIANAWIKFFGVWIAEGWTYIKNADYIARVELSANKKRVLDTVTESCKILNWNYSYNESSQKFYVNEKNIAMYLDTLSVGAIHKRLPKWAFDLSKDQSQLLMNSLCIGDGHETATSLHYSTSSIGLRDDIQQLCQHSGWTSYYAKKCEKGWISKTPNKNGVFFKANADSWDIGIRRTILNPTVNHGHAKTQGGQKEVIETYTGKVYCISVPSEVFLIRRNARIIWTGNSNRHGQKGTVGMLVRSHDMPRSSTGITPDLIMNPHAIPSRMTIGQLLENLLGKAVVNIGAIGNGTPFMNQGSPHEDIGVILERLGFEKYGNEILYNGQTGEQIPSAIFIAPVFAMRLKHMTEDKWNVRAEGRREQRTHQPTGGRGNQGGLRIGEMERDALSGHGISSFIRESYMKRSDGTSFVVCEGCGTIPIYNERQGLYICPMCDGPIEYAGENTNNLELIPPTKRSKAQFSRIEIPYAMVLLNQELESYMNISMRYLTQKGLRHLKKIIAPGLNTNKIDITLVNTPLPERKIPALPAPPTEVLSVMPIIEEETAANTSGSISPEIATATATATGTEDVSGLPHIPSIMESIKPLQEILTAEVPAQQEVQLVEPTQFTTVVTPIIPAAQISSEQGQPTMTQQLAAAPIGNAPQLQAPPAQLLASPTAVAPVILVDTTPTAMIQEGLPTMTVPGTATVQRQKLKLKRPVQQGGEEEEEDGQSVPKHYNQTVQFLRL